MGALRGSAPAAQPSPAGHSVSGRHAMWWVLRAQPCDALARWPVSASFAIWEVKVGAFASILVA